MYAHCMLLLVMPSTSSRLRFNPGFSLVEVVVSIGIVSFAILSIFAMLPVGLATFHNSTEIYFSSQTRQEILNGLQQTDINTLLNGKMFYTEKDYFDDEGTFLGTNGSPVAFASTPVYQVAVTVSTTNSPNSANTSLILPDATTPQAATLTNAVLVTTQFSRYNGTVNTSLGGSTYRTGSDYLYYNNTNVP
jgi:uncharacterized protein (TIGR02598 family)